MSLPADLPAPSSQSQLVDAALPQTQCTRCGYPDCRGYALALAVGTANINRCPPGGAEGIARLAQITGRPPLALDPECGIEGPLKLALIDEAWCIGCTLCLAACPVDCIIGAPKMMHSVIDALCTGCELCLAVCPVDCIEMRPVMQPGALPTSGAVGDRGVGCAGAVGDAGAAPTGWAAWSKAQADESRERYAFHLLRQERDQRENDERLDAKARSRRSFP